MIQRKLQQKQLNEIEELYEEKNTEKELELRNELSRNDSYPRKRTTKFNTDKKRLNRVRKKFQLKELRESKKNKNTTENKPKR